MPMTGFEPVTSVCREVKSDDSLPVYPHRHFGSISRTDFLKFILYILPRPLNDFLCVYVVTPDSFLNKVNQKFFYPSTEGKF